MYRAKSVAVVIPCFNEEVLIRRVLRELPAFVDKVFVINDASSDATSQSVLTTIPDLTFPVELIEHPRNQGVGAAIASGYKRARDEAFDIAVVVAGDAQMDPADMPAILDPVALDEADYSKGNRLFTGDAWNMIPKLRYLGNSALSLLTKIASGYWHVADSQSGYTAINLKALRTIDWDAMYPRYGQPNDLLVRLNIHSFRVRDVPIRPIYGVGEKSGIKPLRMIPRLSGLLFRLFWFRMLQKYVIRDFHPLVFFYALGAVLLPVGTLFGLYLFGYRILVGPIADTSALFSAFLILTGLQFVLFAMWFDMEHNKSLK